MTETYRIHLKGHLADRWADWFEGLAIERLADGTTALTGPITDQAALHGVLARVRDLGIVLLSVDRLPADTQIEPTGGRGP